MDKPQLTGTARSVTGSPQRRSPAGMQELFLRELNPADVFDQPDLPLLPLLSFGTVRETCPHCTGRHLKLILRQETVRVAHLNCEHCNACFEARYANGRCALSI